MGTAAAITTLGALIAAAGVTEGVKAVETLGF